MIKSVLLKIGGMALSVLAIAGAVLAFGLKKKKEGRDELVREQEDQLDDVAGKADQLSDDYDAAPQEEKDERFERWVRED